MRIYSLLTVSTFLALAGSSEWSRFNNESVDQGPLEGVETDAVANPRNLTVRTAKNGDLE